MFIQTEATPNPNTLKFIPGRHVYDGILEFHGAISADMSPFAQTLFKIDGVRSVMFGEDFISVSKNAVKTQSLPLHGDSCGSRTGSSREKNTVLSRPTMQMSVTTQPIYFL